MGPGTPDLKSSFKRSACAPDLPLADSGLEHGMKADLHSVLHVAAPHADIILLGDTDHSRYWSIHDQFRRPEFARALAENGVREVFIEHPTSMAADLNAYKSGAMDRADYTSRYMRSFDSLHSDPADRIPNYMLQMVDVMSGFGIDVIPADFMNGSDVDISDEVSLNLTLQDGAVVQSGSGLSVTTDGTRPATIPELAEKIHNLASARLDDSNVAAFIEESRTGPTVVIFGSAHGSALPQDHPGDLDSNFRPGTRGVKIDIYPDRAAYDRILATADNNQSRFSGADKPDLVYFVAEGEVYTTCDTSPELARDIHAAFPAVNVPFAPGPAERQPMVSPDPHF